MYTDSAHDMQPNHNLSKCSLNAEVMLKINLITGAVSAAGAVGGPLHEHVGPVLGVVVGELPENEVITPKSA